MFPSPISHLLQPIAFPRKKILNTITVSLSIPIPPITQTKANTDTNEYIEAFYKNSKVHDNETRYTDRKQTRDSR